ncbi:MAG: major capsid protein [Campylobacterales bacterium]|nr:major capsid protein [Campylobacterales bacterium]
MKKFLFLLLSVFSLLATNAFAALTPANVSMATASADVTTVVIAIIGLIVVIFGFRKVIGLLSGK